MADLTIVHDVRANQTMSHYKIPPSGKLVFENASDAGALNISSKEAGSTLPFCDMNGKTPITLQPIEKGKPQTVKICDDYQGREFLYTAQIGQAALEDPIVIIEKSKNFALDPLATLFLGAVIGAGIAYFIVKSRANRTRPQQG